MMIQGIDIGWYVLALIISIIIGFATNIGRNTGYKALLNVFILTEFFLFREMFQILNLDSSVWTAWLFHPLTIIIVVGYGIGSFIEETLTLLGGGAN